MPTPGNYFQQVGAQIAMAKLNAHSAVGVNIQFWHRIQPANGTGVLLIAKITSNRNELVEEGGIVKERRVLTTQISTSQIGFASFFNQASQDVEPITQGDQMMFPVPASGIFFAGNPLLPTSRIYQAVDVPADKWGTTFTVKWIEPKRLTAGRK